MNTAVLSGNEAAIYDDGNAERVAALFLDLQSRFGPPTGAHRAETIVYHPDGRLIGHFAGFPTMCHYPVTRSRYPHW